MAKKQGGNPRVVCPRCKNPLTALTRPPKMSYISETETLAINYCVCCHCGGKAVVETIARMREDFFQEDWIKQGS